MHMICHASHFSEVITDQKRCAWQGDDAHPLYIRAVGFTASTAISSDSTDPCAENTITVYIQADGPIFKACVTQITISGLFNTRTADSDLALTGAAVSDGLFVSLGSWTQSSGTLVVSLEADIIKGCELSTFAFNLINRPASYDGVQTVSISTGNPAVILPNADMTVAGNFLNVESIGFNSKTISSDNTDPCGVSYRDCPVPTHAPAVTRAAKC